ncbi:MAG TPA: tRNA lysidine(34) synthetase TilS [Anaeromyxobacter sp.]|nr:tRNA lysidine(34) synthetase TilS [Anaeromyxobacter sp.]
MRKRPLHPFVTGVLATVRRRKLFGPGDHVLAALSGGPDSTALVAALAALRDAGALAALSAVHVDHGLRPGAADVDAATATCRALGVPLTNVAVVVPPGNVQAEARRQRYAALRAEAARAGATRIATGHTRTDQAETVLLRLLRGAGARGLSGIPPRRGAIVRPLLDRSRAEVLAFLSTAGLAWREDPTNASPRYARNRVRHELVPVLAKLAPAAERAIARSAELLRADERALSTRARAAAGDRGADVTRLRAEPLAVRRRIVRRLWRGAARARAGRAAELGAEHVEEVLRLLRRGGTWRLSLPGHVELRHRDGRLEAVPSAPQPYAPGLAPLPVAGPGRFVVPGRALAVRVRARRPELVPWPLELRTRRPGDRFRPDGGAGGKKLKAWLIDRKIPRERRDGLLLLAEGATVIAIPELGALAQGAGPNGAGLDVGVEAL